MKGKKGQLGGLQAAIATIIIVGVLITAAFFIMQEFAEREEFTDTAGTVTNETGGTINTAGYTVAAFSSVAGFGNFVVTQARNATDGSIIQSANYTVLADAGTIVNATSLNYVDVDFDYTYTYGEEAFIGVNDTLGSLVTIPELLGLVILIIILGIILGIIFNVIPGTRINGA